jgi:hypothetical protein
VHEQGGSAIRRAQAAILSSMLVLLLGSGVAHARPQLAVTEAEARAGDPVHFSVSGTEGLVEYELEIGDREVIEGAAVGNPILGQFAMPDLGADARVVKLEAHIELLGKTTKVKHKIRYAGAAAAASGPPAAPTAAVPDPVAPAAVAPVQPPAVQAPLAPAETSPPPPESAAIHVAGQVPRKAGVQRTSRRQPAGRAVERKRPVASEVKRSRAKRRNHPRTAPLFDGIPESSGGSAAGGGGDGFHALNAILPPAPSISTPGAGGDSALSAAVLVPGLLAVAALMLAGTALARRRRLAAG